MNITIVLDFDTEPVIFLRAWLINLDCNPMQTPISPSNSALGVNAATEFTTKTEIEPDLLMCQLSLKLARLYLVEK